MNLAVKLPVKSASSGMLKWFVRTYDDALPVVTGDRFEIVPGGAEVLVSKRTYLASLRSFELELRELILAPSDIAELRENGWEDAT